MTPPTLLWTAGLVLFVSDADWQHGHLHARYWTASDAEVMAGAQLMEAGRALAWKLKEGETGRRFLFQGFITRWKVQQSSRRSGLTEHQLTITLDGPLLTDDPWSTPVPGVNELWPMDWDAAVVSLPQALETGKE